MYIMPRGHKCPECGHKMYSQGPEFCPECLRKFLAKHVPTTVPDTEAKPYNPNEQIAYF